MTLKLVGTNQTELHKNNGFVILFSYDTPVAAKVGTGWIKTNKFYSNTASKHINRWLSGHDVEEVDQSVINALCNN